MASCGTVVRETGAAWSNADLSEADSECNAVCMSSGCMSDEKARRTPPFEAVCTSYRHRRPAQPASPSVRDRQVRYRSQPGAVPVEVEFGQFGPQRPQVEDVHGAAFGTTNDQRLAVRRGAFRHQPRRLAARQPRGRARTGSWNLEPGVDSRVPRPASSRAKFLASLRHVYWNSPVSADPSGHRGGYLPPAARRAEREAEVFFGQADSWYPSRQPGPRDPGSDRGTLSFCAAMPGLRATVPRPLSAGQRAGR